MAFGKKVYDMGDVVDYEYTYLGKYGARGEKRAARIKPTPEQIAKQKAMI